MIRWSPRISTAMRPPSFAPRCSGRRTAAGASGRASRISNPPRTDATPSRPIGDPICRPGWWGERFQNITRIASLVIEKDLGFASFLSSTSWLEKQSDSYNDYSGFAAELSLAYAGTALPLYPLVSLDPVNYKQISEEIRLVSAKSDRFNWIVGAYYNDTDQRVGQYMQDDAYANFLYGVFGVSPVGSVYGYDQHNSDRQKALFTEGDLTVATRWHLIAGARYYDLKQTFRSVQSGILAGPDQPLTRSGASGVNPKASIKYDATPAAMFYATAAAGFRAGGPNPGLVGPCTLTSVYQTAYGDDKVWNYEVGAKLAPAGSRATLNLAAFQINWHDIQQSVIDPGCGSLFTANVGRGALARRGGGADVAAAVRIAVVGRGFVCGCQVHEDRSGLRGCGAHFPGRPGH